MNNRKMFSKIWLNFNLKYIIFWVSVITGLSVDALKPWAPDLSTSGHKLLMNSIIGIGLWVPCLDELLDPCVCNIYCPSSFLEIFRYSDAHSYNGHLVPVLPDVATAYGISPIVWTAVFFMTGNCFFLNYTTMFALVGESVSGNILGQTWFIRLNVSDKNKCPSTVDLAL